MFPRHISILVSALCLASASAQTALQTRFHQQLQPTPSQLGEVADTDKKLVISKVATALNQHVSFQPNLTATSFIQTTSGRNFVEWKNLRINQLIPTRITDSDRKNGVTKRIQATLTFDASRLKDTKTGQWKNWGTSTHSLFPPAITVVWRNGHPVVESGPYLNTFKPGNQATAQAQPQDVAGNDRNTKQEIRATKQLGTIKPASGLSLPPGMRRR